MLDAIEDSKGGAGGPVEVRVSQVKTGAIERQVSRGRELIGLDSIRVVNMGKPNAYLAKQT